MLDALGNRSVGWRGDRVTVLAFSCFLLAGSTTVWSLAMGKRPPVYMAAAEGLLLVTLIWAATTRPSRFSVTTVLLACALGASCAVLLRWAVMALTAQ